jgi:hypothetical protein
MTCPAKSQPEKLKLQGQKLEKYLQWFVVDACFQQEGGLIALTGSPQYVSSIFVIL